MSFKKKIIEIAKDGSNLSFLKVFGTVLTAISVSLISTKLTGAIPTLALVALASLGTMLLNEFYRIFLAFTAKEVISPILKVEEDKETGELITTAIPIQPETVQSENKKKSKNNIIMGLMFLIVSLLTIGINQYSLANDKDNHYTTIEQNVTQEINDEMKQEIIDETLSKIPEPTPTVIVTNEPSPSTETDDILVLQENNKELSERINELEGVMSEQSEIITSLEVDIENLKNQSKNVQEVPLPVPATPVPSSSPIPSPSSLAE